jgi:hypothetical protein
MAIESKRTTRNSTPNAFPAGYSSPQEVKAGDKITAENLRNMISLVENLLDHSHQWTDTYASNCQCACSRGAL